MSKQMIINASAAEEIRVAIVENNRLVDLDVESQTRTKQKGNIYKGIVANVEDSLEAAFIEFGDDKQGFLALSEVRPALYPEELSGHKRPKISDILKRGQEIVVQVTKDEIGSKGAAVTTYLSLPGRYVVLMHSDDGGGGISRKIDDEGARRRARDMLSRIEVPEGMAVIIRTAGMNRPRVDLYRDLEALAKAWEQIDRGAQLGRAPTLLYREPDLIVRTIRDYLAPDIQKIVIDAEEEFEDVRSYFEDHMPEGLEHLERHEGNQPIFEHFGIERAIEELFEREVKLPAGGSLVIDQAEALVAVDVNSGRSTKEDDHEATVYKTNLEAARELARQLRLRDLGGIIVVDFIDMNSRRHDRDVERALKDAMRADKAKVKIGRISENGTLELTRQRLRQAHRLVSFTPCAHCKGTGSVRDPEGLAISALRQLHAHVARRKSIARVTCRLPVEVANVLSNRKRRDLLELSEDHDTLVEVVGDEKLTGDEIRFDDERRGRAGIEAAHGVKDPRLEEGRRGGRGRGRRGRRGQEESHAPQQTVPPPSIGPVPTFLADEAGFAELDQIAYAEEEAAAVEAEAAPAQQQQQREARRFDDALMDALFGDPPVELSLEEAEAEAAEVPEEAAPKKKRRRSRRRRGRKKTGEGEGAEASGDERGDDGQDDGQEDGPEDTQEDDGSSEDQVHAVGNGVPLEAEAREDDLLVPSVEVADEVALVGAVDPDAAVEVEAEAEAAPKKKRSRPRRSRAKKAPVEGEAAAADPAEAEAEAEAEVEAGSEAAAAEGEEDTPRKAAPRSRRRRRPRDEASSDEEPNGESAATEV